MFRFYFIISAFSTVYGLNCLCGVENINSRIGGGETVTENRYPWLAIIRARVRNGQYLNCAGSIINDLFILTAAHCVEHSLEVVSIKVSVGTNIKHQDNEFVYAEKWMVHEKFRRSPINHDIAIIKLRQPLQFDYKVLPICLPNRGDVARGRFTVAGWGLTETGNSSSVLLQAYIREYPFEKCLASWQKYRTIDNKLQICASSENTSSCSGDSGGPLMKKIDGRFYVAGITSFGNKTATCGLSYNTVYTRVEPYLDWVYDNVGTVINYVSSGRHHSVSRKISSLRKSSSKLQGCDVSKEAAVNALQELFLFGDPDMFLPDDHCDIVDHCDNVVEKANKKLSHLRCLDHGATKFSLGVLAKGYIAVNEKRCSSKEWRKKFLYLSDCVKSSTAAADIHQCGYKLHDSFKYSLDNFDVDHQLQFGCCAMHKMDVCIHTQLVKDCGDEVAEFGPELFWEPVREAFSVSCPGVETIQKCRQIYPKEMKELDTIFASSKKLSPRNFMVPGYQLLENRGDKLPEFAPAK